MKQQIDTIWIANVAEALLDSDAKTATKYLSPKLVVRATWHNKPNSRNLQECMVVTFGRPNSREVAYIKLLKKAKEPFPVKRVILKPWPKKKAK